MNSDEFGRSLLHYAAADADTEAVKKLLAEGAQVNLADRYQWTPLHFAAQAYSADIVRELLSAGAIVDPRDDNGNTPLSTAVFNCRGIDGTLIKILRSNGANPFAANDYGVSPVSLAYSIGNYDISQYFSDLPKPD